MRCVRAISVQQPYAELIVRGVKDVENRVAPVSHRGPLLIHASKKVNRRAVKHYGFEGRVLATGALVGVVNLTDCTTERGSEWHNPGMVGWYLDDPRRFSAPLRFSGNVGLLKVPLARVRGALVGARRPRLGDVLQLFSFGYFGWGNATRQLLAVTSAVEAARGFRPPVFVDIRLSRAVRAEGFRERAFEEMLGFERYRWMRTLGNRSIRTGENRVRIVAPDAAEQLLDLALDARRDGRRVVCFCACETPRRCHRRTVGELVLRAARRRGLTAVMSEWPGGHLSAGVVLDMRVTPRVYDRILGSQVWLPLPRSMPLAEIGALAPGSVARLRARRRAAALVMLGNVRPRDGRWCVEALYADAETDDWDIIEAARTGRRERRLLGYAPFA